MHYVLTLFILNCVGTFFGVHGNIHSEIADEIQRHVSPILAKYSELETINLENQRKIVELQNEVLILKQENDFKTSDLLEVTQQLQKLSQAKLAPNHLSGDICQYVDEQCPRKSREDRQTAHTIAFSAYIEHLGGNNHVGNTLLYNKVLGNYGNGYDTNTGIFTAPETGIYAFLWVTQVHHGSWCSTRMLRNGFILSMTASYAKAASTSLTESGSGTGFLITYMNQGDTASVEMNNPTSTPCNIVSNDKGITTFSGWKIARI